MTNIVKRFLKYVAVDTTSNPNSNTVPSTMKQLDLSKILLQELLAINVEAHLDDKGYLYAKLLNNTKREITPIGFIAHVDTSFDAPGLNIKPKIINNYDGSDIILNDNITMNSNNNQALTRVIGDDIIVTDGNTLLGADDKAGVAIIMELVETLVSKPEIPHGDIYICFTPDEEIGRGADHFNYDFFKAEFAYTFDGSEVGGIEYENFNAATATLEFIGKSIHPGSSKGQMINANLLLEEFNTMLPTFLNPAYTEDYEGFNHLTSINGSVEKANSQYIIRNHNMELFNSQKEDFVRITEYMNNKYQYHAVTLNITDSYYNMYEVIKDNMHIIELANKAITNVGLIPFSTPIRGGTDGARLTFEGLPCPNLGTGGYNFHGRMEFLSINQMTKALKVGLEIVNLLTK